MFIHEKCISLARINGSAAQLYHLLCKSYVSDGKLLCGMWETRDTRRYTGLYIGFRRSCQRNCWMLQLPCMYLTPHLSLSRMWNSQHNCTLHRRQTQHKREVLRLLAVWINRLIVYSVCKRNWHVLSVMVGHGITVLSIFTGCRYSAGLPCLC